ncbi:TPA: S4 domain-containing protein YaaA [Candidatus Avacholeplasma faecigallinarum]|nr:S4 domain-containing protein YaaA [Candidatus Avacholeplasma faecigallinarum]
MKTVKINDEYITLQQLLKMENIISSGGEAKYFLAENPAVVDGEIENRRGRKLYKDMVIKIGNEEFVIK